MKKILPALIIIILLSACGPSVTAAPTPAPPEPPPALDEFGCISSIPTQADIDRALSYTGGLFDTPDWERSYYVADSRVAVTWFSTTLSAVAFLEALIFPCGYEEPDLDLFYSHENWQIIFENYERFEYAGQCGTNDGLRLYQFKGVDQGLIYDIQYWSQNDTMTRVMSMMIVFPAETPSLTAEYSNRLFPRLTSCP
jgi:hypothetical protein